MAIARQQKRQNRKLFEALVLLCFSNLSLRMIKSKLSFQLSLGVFLQKANYTQISVRTYAVPHACRERHVGIWVSTSTVL